MLLLFAVVVGFSSEVSSELFFCFLFLFLGVVLKPTANGANTNCAVVQAHFRLLVFSAAAGCNGFFLRIFAYASLISMRKNYPSWCMCSMCCVCCVGIIYILLAFFVLFLQVCPSKQNSCLLAHHQIILTDNLAIFEKVTY
jgi:hypothetical protein